MTEDLSWLRCVQWWRQGEDETAAQKLVQIGTSCWIEEWTSQWI